ncbi:RNA helicase [Lachnoanaerobaculum gingivalis]|uniref:RNA helicase n=1 Tax=Lachnoanaerobaculum gingivalis TaxID=2490855 RepID=A0A3P3QW59_9FIRM|nr:AAA family ATPase [Lachnoanaerobaculum gingivalis]RRJ25497.1 RNA helicase [Lachnoanaerobaculum gingivalis]
MGFKTDWIQDAMNHRAIFDTFYRDIVPNQSLVIAYTKQVPFVEDTRRVIIGMGHVKRYIPAVEHEHTDENTLRSMTWEGHICHSIRSDHQDGFVIPYQEMMEYANTHLDFDISSITVFAPDDAFEEFSYATEHVSHDATIEVILSCIKAFEIINNCLDEDYSNVLTWLNIKLSEVWEDRGAFPGMGAMLTALELPLGVLIARQIKEKLKDGDDIWKNVELLFEDPESVVTNNLAVKVTPVLKLTWKHLPPERKVLFKLLSRLSLSIDQAKMLFYANQREKAGIYCTDDEIIRNPYILYEKTRLKIDGLYVSVCKVDRAVFPIPYIREKYPLDSPTILDSDNDQRRIRAVAIAVLEEAANKGHTILPKAFLVDAIKSMNLEPSCPVTTDIIEAVKKFLMVEIIKREMKDGTEYYKLIRIQEFDDIIEHRISRRINAPRLSVKADWRKMLDDKFNDGSKISEQEERARTEKAAILGELAQSRISVLVGDAGTGKTTVLSVLCSHPDIKSGGVLLLAPTGKATVRLLDSMGDDARGITALNVAQFLVRSKRFEWDDMRYVLSDSDYKDVPDTVIVDESSMLTEEMFGALIQALRRAKRIIFVGDPNQLPPIGAGRPFVDLVYMLKVNLDKGVFPLVCSHYGELTVNRRQKADEVRSDVLLSRLFTTSEQITDDDVIIDIEKNRDPNIEIKQWHSREDLEQLLLETMAKEIGMKDIDDQEAFDLSLGGVKTDFGIYFNTGAASFAEKWQILAPVRNMPQGVMNINRLIHLKYREKFLKISKKWGMNKRIANSLGPEAIVYGDKVINVINTSQKKGYPEKEARNYIANGEIGIACGDYNKSRSSWRGHQNDMRVEFSSQPGISYSFDKSDFNEENGTAQLELAYALTVHKAQGSQFNTVILVLAEPCKLLSKEMLYTALTRQQGKIIILYNQEPYHLLKYTSVEHSDIAKRFTDLFRDVYKEEDDGPDMRPQIDEVNGRFYENKLIHKTIRGELVRSKSEVIIANQLHLHGVEYEYEPELELEGKIKRPDFKIEDYDTGIVWYWEHCGMMEDSKYMRRWEKKKVFYKKNGIEEGKNLIVTYDEHGSIDTEKIDRIIVNTFDVG